MKPYNLMKKKFGDVDIIECLFARYEVCYFQESIDHYHDRISSMVGGWKSHYKSKAKIFPNSIQYEERSVETDVLLGALVYLASVILLHQSSNIPS